jgi:hypothetical protein
VAFLRDALHQPDPASLAAERRATADCVNAGSAPARRHGDANGDRCTARAGTGRQARSQADQADPRAHLFRDKLVQSRGEQLLDVAQRENLCGSYFTRLVRLTYLAPDITRAILDSRQPRDLTAEKLFDQSRLPLTSPEQRRALGFT